MLKQVLKEYFTFWKLVFYNFIIIAAIERFCIQVTTCTSQLQ